MSAPVPSVPVPYQTYPCLFCSPVPPLHRTVRRICRPTATDLGPERKTSIRLAGPLTMENRAPTVERDSPGTAVTTSDQEDQLPVSQ